MNFSQWLDFHLKAKGWKPHFLAKKAGVHPSTLSKYSSGNIKNPEHATVEKLVNALELSEDAADEGRMLAWKPSSNLAATEVIGGPEIDQTIFLKYFRELPAPIRAAKIADIIATLAVLNGAGADEMITPEPFGFSVRVEGRDIGKDRRKVSIQTLAEEIADAEEERTALVSTEEPSAEE